MEPRRDKPDCDYIEVHIYGPLHCAAIQSVRGPVPKDRADRVLWQQVKRKLGKLGASWVEC
jgi:hypothetical protein